MNDSEKMTFPILFFSESSAEYQSKEARSRLDPCHLWDSVCAIGCTSHLPEVNWDPACAHPAASAASCRGLSEQEPV